MSGYGDIYGPLEAVAEYPETVCRRCNDYPCQCLADDDGDGLWEAYEPEEPEAPAEPECPACGFLQCACEPLTAEEIEEATCPF